MNTSSGKTILLVEDEVIIAMNQKMSLEKYGYRVIMAHSGDQAVEISKSIPGIDIILMDIDLGKGIDGTVAAGLILKNRDIPIVFLSSHTEPEIVEKTEEITSYGYVVKNSGITVLDASIKMAFKLFYANQRFYEKKITLEAALNSMTDAVFISDISGTFIEFNDAFVSFHRFRDKAECAQNLADYPEIIDVFMSNGELAPLDMWAVSRALRGESVTNAEYKLRRKDSGEIWYGSYNFSPIRDTAGAIVGSVVVGRDITELKVAEDKLREKDILLRKLFANIPDLVFQFTRKPDGNYCVPIASEGIKNIFGCKPEDVLDNFDPIARVIYPDDVARVLADIEYSAEHLSYFTCEFRVVLPEKGLQWIYSRSAPEKLPDGSITWYGFNANITDRKLAEHALQKESTLLSMIMETSPVGITTVDEAGNITYANYRAEQILGLKKSEITARSYDAPLWNHTEIDGSPYPDEKQPFYIVKTTQRSVYDVHQGITWPDGRSVFLSINASPLKDNNGLFFGMVATIEDITERMRAGKMILQQLEEKETLLKEVHHRIKNNITSIESLLRLKAESIPNIEIKKVLHDIMGSVQSMRIIYEKLLRTTDYKETSVKNYLEELIAAIESMYPDAKKISITRTIEDFELNVKILFPLGAIVNELITNAMKYAFLHKESGLIDISLVKREDEIILTVHDDGDSLPSNFDVNKTNGFGLMLVKMLAQQLKGSFSIQNKNGAECIVRFIPDM